MCTEHRDPANSFYACLSVVPFKYGLSDNFADYVKCCFYSVTIVVFAINRSHTNSHIVILCTTVN